MSKKFQGKVKSVISGDSIVLVSPNHKGRTAPLERVVSLAFILAPRNDEVFAFESREYLRNLLVGKVVNVRVINVAPSGREFVDISSPIFASLAAEVVSNGYAKVRERASDEEAEELKDLESKAKADQLGLWSSKAGRITVQDSLTPKQIEKSQSSPLRAIVERVLSGDRLKLRFLLDKSTHAELLVHVAGVRAPTATSPIAAQAQYFIELFELARVVSVTIVGELANGIPIAKITTKDGILSDRLLKEGLVEVDDRQSITLGAAAMTHLRGLQQEAKLQSKGQWTASPAAGSTPAATVTSVGQIKPGSKISATVSRVVSADTIRLYLANDQEITVSLASVRGPRQNDAATAPFIDLARDFVRKKAIGKKVTVKVDAIRPKSDNFDERPLGDIVLANGTSLSSLIIESGWATVIRHRRDDTDRSPQWDLYLELEQAATKGKKGIHGKVPEVGKIVEASENKTRASSLLHSFKSRNNISAVVEAVLSYNRFRIFVPRDSIRLTLVLGGLANTSSDPNAAEINSQAFTFVNKKATQRDVHINVYSTDKTGAFVGNLVIAGQTLPLQLSLLAQGLAKLHDFSVGQTGFESEFVEAQTKAQELKLGYWKNFDASAVAAEEPVENLTKATQQLSINPKYHNVKVTYVSDDGVIYFRILDPAGDKFKSFQENFRSALSSSSAPKASVKSGEIVAAKDSQNDLYYRARVISNSKGTIEVQHIDNGVFDSVSLSSIAVLPQAYSTTAYPAQARSAKLALVHLPPSQPQDYLSEAIDLIYDLTPETSQLVAIEYRTKPVSGIDMDVSLVDFSAVQNGADENESINRELVRNGLAIVDSKIGAFEKALKSEYDTLLQLQDEAKRQHIGCWQFGDIEQDDDL